MKSVWRYFFYYYSVTYLRRPTSRITSGTMLMKLTYVGLDWTGVPEMKAKDATYTRKAVRHRNLRQARATPLARNGSRDVIDHVTSDRFPICHFP